MNERSLRLPGSATLLVVMWSSFELLVCCVGLDSYLNSGAAIGLFLVSFCLAGLFAGWLFVVTWLLLGARPTVNSMVPMIEATEFRALLIRDRCFRSAILCVVTAQMMLLVLSTHNGRWCVGLLIAGSVPCLAWPTVYRQITGRRIGKYAPQVAASLDIRGIMLVTIVIAVASSVCRGTENSEPEALVLAVAFGAAVGLMWLGVMLWMLHRRRRWFLLSVLGAWLPIGIVAQAMLMKRSLGPDLVDQAVVGSLTLYVHAVVYFGTLRASDYRLGLDTSPSNLR